MKMVKAGNPKTINLTAAQPIRQGDSLKDSPAKQRKGIAKPLFRRPVYLVHCMYITIVSTKLSLRRTELLF